MRDRLNGLHNTQRSRGQTTPMRFDLARIPASDTRGSSVAPRALQPRVRLAYIIAPTAPLEQFHSERPTPSGPLPALLLIWSDARRSAVATARSIREAHTSRAAFEYMCLDARIIAGAVRRSDASDGPDVFDLRRGGELWETAALRAANRHPKAAVHSSDAGFRAPDAPPTLVT